MQQLGWREIAANLCLFLDLLPATDLDSLTAGGTGSTLAPDEQDALASSLLARAPPARVAELGLDKAALRQWVDVALDLSLLARTYTPSGHVSSPVSVFVAVPLAGLGTKDEWRARHLEPWHTFAKHPPRFVDVQGSHYTMLSDEHVDSFYHSLAYELDEAGV